MSEINNKKDEIIVKDLQDIGVEFPNEVKPNDIVTKDLLATLFGDDNSQRKIVNMSVLIMNPGDKVKRFIGETLVDMIYEGHPFAINLESQMEQVLQHEAEKTKLIGANIIGINDTVDDVGVSIHTLDGKIYNIVRPSMPYEVSCRLVDSSTFENGEVREVRLTIEGLEKEIDDYFDTFYYNNKEYRKVFVDGLGYVTVDLGTIKDNRVKPLSIDGIGNVATVRQKTSQDKADDIARGRAEASEFEYVVVGIDGKEYSVGTVRVAGK